MLTDRQQIPTESSYVTVAMIWQLQLCFVSYTAATMLWQLVCYYGYAMAALKSKQHYLQKFMAGPNMDKVKNARQKSWTFELRCKHAQLKTFI